MAEMLSHDSKIVLAIQKKSKKRKSRILVHI